MLTDKDAAKGGEDAGVADDAPSAPEDAETRIPKARICRPDRDGKEKGDAGFTPDCFWR